MTGEGARSRDKVVSTALAEMADSLILIRRTHDLNSAEFIWCFATFLREWAQLILEADRGNRG